MMRYMNSILIEWHLYLIFILILFFFLSEEFYEMEYCGSWNVNLFIKWRWMMRFDIYYGIVFFDKVYSKLGEWILENDCELILDSGN